MESVSLQVPFSHFCLKDIESMGDRIEYTSSLKERWEVYLNFFIHAEDMAAARNLKDRIRKIYDNRADMVLCRDDIEDSIDTSGMDPEILFVDIDDRVNIDRAGSIKEKYPGCNIVFISGPEKYTTDMYDVDHVYYLMKPIDDASLMKALHKAADAFNKDVCFSFSSSHKNYVVRLKDIVYMEKDRRKVRLILADGRDYEFYSAMEHLLPKLTEHFIRCHNSYIINMMHAESVGADSCIMDNNVSVPISRAYSRSVRKAFLEYLEKNSI